MHALRHLLADPRQPFSTVTCRKSRTPLCRLVVAAGRGLGYIESRRSGRLRLVRDGRPLLQGDAAVLALQAIGTPAISVA